MNYTAFHIPLVGWSIVNMSTLHRILCRPIMTELNYRSHLCLSTRDTTSCFMHFIQHSNCHNSNSNNNINTEQRSDLLAGHTMVGVQDTRQSNATAPDDCSPWFQEPFLTVHLGKSGTRRTFGCQVQINLGSGNVGRRVAGGEHYTKKKQRVQACLTPPPFTQQLCGWEAGGGTMWATKPLL